MRKMIAFILCLILSITGSSCVFADENKDIFKKCIKTSVSWDKEYHSLTEMTEDSDYILYGVVRKQQTIENAGLVFTLSTINVQDVIKGAPESEIIITQIGGEDTLLIAEAPEESLILTMNQVYCFFLSKE